MTQSAVTLDELFEENDGPTDRRRTRRRSRSARRGEGGGERRRDGGSLCGRGLALLLMIAVVAVLSLRAPDETQVLVLKLFAVVVLSFLPGWLFLRFVTARSESVYKEYVLNLHRLGVDRPGNLPEPPVGSIYHPAWTWARSANPSPPAGETDIYTDKFEAYYGKSIVKGAKQHRLKAETFFPVMLATVVFAAGWTTVLGDTSFLALPGSPSTYDLLAVSFVGAYLFTIQMLVRRYFQADLKASAYVNSVIRIVSALVLVAVVDISLMNRFDPAQEFAVAFVVGFFPLVGLQAIQKLAAVSLKLVVPSLKNDYPLSDLDGLSVWYESRLLELGIEDLENLATANLVDVILHSRVPVAQGAPGIQPPPAAPPRHPHRHGPGGGVPPQLGLTVHGVRGRGPRPVRREPRAAGAAALGPEREGQRPERHPDDAEGLPHRSQPRARAPLEAGLGHGRPRRAR